MSNHPSLPPKCPHGVLLEHARCMRCEDPAFDAAQQPPVNVKTISVGGTAPVLTNERVMATPTLKQLSDPAFTALIIDAIRNHPERFESPFKSIVRPYRPKFRKMREVHATRARKLRKRGEYVHFLRWEHGHCIYGWGGPMPDSFTFQFGPAQRRGCSE